MAKFSDTPWYIIEEYLNKIAEQTIDVYYSQNVSNDSYITGPRNIQVEDNLKGALRLYSKNDSSDYKELKVTVPQDWEDYNLIKLNHVNPRAVVPSDTIKRIVKESELDVQNTLSITSTEGGYTIPEGEVYIGTEKSSYYQETYDYLQDGYVDNVDQEDDIYIRKDSFFLDWVEDNWVTDTDIPVFKGFLNKNLKYVYLGKGFIKPGNILEVNYWAIKDWMRTALPENNRTPNFQIFLDLIFDRLYNKVYNKQKNIFTLIDPFEVDADFFNDLVEFYGTTPLDSLVEKYRVRLFIENLIYLLKMKGTYSSLFIIWQMLSEGTNNILTIYDRWHDPVLPPIWFGDDEPDYTVYQIWWKDGRLYYYYDGIWAEFASEKLYGNLEVNISGETADSTAVTLPSVDLWKLVGYTTEYENDDIVNLPIGPYTIAFNDISGWDTPNNTNAIVYNNETSTKTAIYTRHSGSVTTTILPASVVTAGAQWRLVSDDVTYDWQNSGVTLDYIPSGSYTLELSAVYGWDLIDDIDVEVTKDSAQEFSVTYDRQYGTLRVDILPEGTASQAGRWTVRDQDPNLYSQKSSGDTVTLPVGTYSVYFTELIKWTAPDEITDIEILDGELTSLEATYTQKYGWYKPIIDNAGTQYWRIKSGPTSDPDLLPENVAKKLLTGTYVITFPDIPNFDTPADSTIEITEAYTELSPLIENFEYTRQTGLLIINIDPAGAVSDGAKWGISEYSHPYSDGQEVTLDAGKDYWVYFKSISGWTKPEPISLSVYNNYTTEETGTYEQLFSITVYLEKGAVPGGETDPSAGNSLYWQCPQYSSSALFSGATIYVPAGGTYTLNFLSQEGWTSPSSVTITNISADYSNTFTYTWTV